MCSSDLEFVSAIVHDIRSPLTVVSAMASLARRRRREDLGPLLDEIQQGARRIDSMLTEIADARRERLEMHPEPVSVAALLEQVVTDQRAVDGDRRYHLQTQSLDGVVGAWDEGLIRRVLDNVLSNARKFSDPGTDVVVFASWRPDEIVVRVTDEGAGIAAEDLPHVLEPFRRGRNAAGTGGSGVGLANVANIVRLHGGTVQLDSIEGQGTSVTLRLPASRAHAGERLPA